MPFLGGLESFFFFFAEAVFYFGLLRLRFILSWTSECTYSGSSTFFGASPSLFELFSFENEISIYFVSFREFRAACPGKFELSFIVLEEVGKI